MLTSYHVHSVRSDGMEEIADIVRAARRMGLDELGLSDHYLPTSDGRGGDWAMPLESLDEYMAAIQDAAGEAGESMVVRAGVEMDYFPESAEVAGRLIASEPFDYVIGSVHFVGPFSVDESAENWECISQAERDEIITTYWTELADMARTGYFDIVGHMDLVKKFGYRASCDTTGLVEKALDAIAAADMSVELNTAGWEKPCEEAYPSPAIIRGCLKRGIPMVVSADAHESGDLIRDYGRACELLRELGYTEHASYAGRRRMMHPLAELAERIRELQTQGVGNG